MSLRQKVSSAIRILRWNRDVSARASHLVEVFNFQAGSGNVSGSTFSERKNMSTKTSFKRIAAVAAVALALGGFSAVSANAVNTGTAVGTGVVNYTNIFEPSNLGSFAISAAAQASGTLTFTVASTGAAASALIGDSVVISGASDSAYNGTYAITGNAGATDIKVASVLPSASITGNALILTSSTGAISNATGWNINQTATPSGYTKLTPAANISTLTSAALAFTGTTSVSAAPASATYVLSGSALPNLLVTVTGTSVTASGTSVSLGANTSGNTELLKSNINGYTVVATATAGSASLASQLTGYQSQGYTGMALVAGSDSSAYIKVSTTAAGTASGSLVVNSTVAGQNTTKTIEAFTVVIGTGSASTAYSTTTVAIAGTTGVSQQVSSTGTVYASSSNDTGIAATVSATPIGTTGLAITDSSLQTGALTATIAGVGSFAANGKTTNTSTQYANVPAYTWASGSNNSFSVYGDGRAGTSAITISVGGVAVKTVTVIFYGKVASLTATANYNILYANGAGATTGSLAAAAAATGTPAGFVNGAVSTTTMTADDDPALVIVAKDANGNVVPLNPTVTAYSVVSSSPASFSQSILCTGSTQNTAIDSGVGTYTNGFGAGLACLNSTPTTKSGDKGTITISYTNSDGTIIVAPAISLTAGGKPDKATLTPDSTTYLPGAKGYFTLAATDASGNPVADDQGFAAFFAAAPKVSGAFQFLGTTISGTITGTVLTASSSASVLSTTQYFVNGVVKDYFYAPVSDGDWTVTATTGTGFTSAGQGAAVNATVTVGSATTAASQAATDAAQEATDAANAAYDAANNAMDSADAATAAAQDASDNASAALAAVTSLSATVAKLVSSVTAIATALAAIKKKLGVK